MSKFKYTPFLLSIAFLLISIYAVKNNTPHNTQQVNATTTASYDEADDDMKGVWVSYISLDMQNTDMTENAFTDKINTIINITKDSGFNTLIFQVRPFGDALYKSQYYPWSHILTGTQGESPDYDPLEIIVALCHKNNINVHAWINPYRVSTSQTPKQLSDDNPYIKDRAIGFEHNDSIYLDPSNDKAQRLIVNGVSEIVKKYDVDGIQFDDYFYPENSDEVDDGIYQIYADNTENPLSKEDWRAENVNSLIKKVYETVHKSSDKIVFGISPQGNISNNKALGADVKTWCEKEHYIDYICPQIYFSLDNPSLTFEESLNDWLSIDMHNKLKMYVGLAGYKGGTDEDEGTWLDNNDILANEIKICEEKGLDGFMLYSYESFYNDENEDEINSVVKHITGISE